MTVDLTYNVTNGKLYFPPSAGDSQGSFGPADTGMYPAPCSRTQDMIANPALAGLSISASPVVTEGVTFAAHIVPSVCHDFRVAEQVFSPSIVSSYLESALLRTQPRRTLSSTSTPR